MFVSPLGASRQTINRPEAAINTCPPVAEINRHQTSDIRLLTSDNRHQEVTQIAIVSQNAGKQGFFVISGRNQRKNYEVLTTFYAKQTQFQNRSQKTEDRRQQNQVKIYTQSNKDKQRCLNELNYAKQSQFY